MQNFMISDKSRSTISINSDKERTFNGCSYQQLNDKKNKFKKKFQNIADKKDLYLYYNMNPILLNKNKEMKFMINKNDLNNFFVESKIKRMNDEIYYNQIFKLINPYYLVEHKKFLNKKYLSKEIIDTLNDEKNLLYERSIFINNNKYYDNNKNISFEIPNKNDVKYSKYYKISNEKLIKDSINKNCLVVKLINEDDGFEKILLLKRDTCLEDLKSLIIFLYKSKYKKKINEKITLYREDNDEVIDNVKTLDELSKLMGSKHELGIIVEVKY